MLSFLHHWESVNLLQMSKKKIIITMMKNNYFIIKKYISKHSKKKDVLVCNIYIIAKNEEFQFIW